MSDLSLAAEEIDRRIETLGKNIKAYSAEISELRDTLAFKEQDLATLRDRLTQVKEVQAWLASQGAVAPEGKPWPPSR